MQENKRTIWQLPWGYPATIAIVCGIIAVGFILQGAIGSFNFYLLAMPINMILGGAIVVGTGLSLFFQKNSFVRWLSSGSLAIVLIISLLSLTIIMGLTPQLSTDSKEELVTVFSKLGFDRMTRSWSFVLIYVLTLISLGCLIVRRLRNFRWRDYAFYSNHIGLWLALFASGFGYADMERYVMHVREGEVEWRVYDEEGGVKELPIAIELIDFDMEVYPPKLTIIDRQSGAPQPEMKPDYFQIDPKNPDGILDGWTVKLEEYIHDAVRNSDSTYQEVPMPGAAPAARVSMQNPKTGKTLSGWVCGGNQAQLYMVLNLDPQYCVAMTEPEPKRFISSIKAYRPDGVVKETVLEVNHPLQFGHWTIYQFGYDNQAGRLSSYSSMELVYDPWLYPVYVGFLLMAIGSLVMVCRGKINKRGKDE